MKNIKLFENFGASENDTTKFRDGFPKEKVPVTLDVSFGQDQVSNVENILTKMKDQKHVSEFKQFRNTKGGDLVGYTIEFTSAYGVYLFGHMQGALRID